MATKLADIIAEAMLYIDDVRLQEQLQTNPALFCRRMSAYVTSAMPLLSNPPELYHHISKDFVPATYTSYEWVSTEESTTQETVVETGFSGYELVTAVVRSEDGEYVTAYSDFTYDSETGNITFPIQSMSGIDYEVDFYTDGEVADLTLSMLRLYGLAVTVVWYQRLDNNWLNITPKIRDSSFSTINESNYMDKMDGRMKSVMLEFRDELRKYEQNNAYVNLHKPIPQRKLI